jgi:hypothetical protein|tara:strand:- start:1135 stop:1632 length:498 start_codon:yes stop_codon:yes gene_type:complete
MADFTSTITESVVLNGSVRGSTNSILIPDITNVGELILECPAGVSAAATTVIGTWATTVNPTGVKYQNYDFNDSEYVRVTNLDPLLPCEVNWVSKPSTGVSSCRFLLKPGQSSIMWTTLKGVFGDNSVVTPAVLNDLSYIEITNTTFSAEALPLNVELFTASKKA